MGGLVVVRRSEVTVLASCRDGQVPIAIRLGSRVLLQQGVAQIPAEYVMY